MLLVKTDAAISSFVFYVRRSTSFVRTTIPDLAETGKLKPGVPEPPIPATEFHRFDGTHGEVASETGDENCILSETEIFDRTDLAVCVFQENQTRQRPSPSAGWIQSNGCLSSRRQTRPGGRCQIDCQPEPVEWRARSSAKPARPRPGNGYRAGYWRL